MREPCCTGGQRQPDRWPDRVHRSCQRSQQAGQRLGLGFGTGCGKTPRWPPGCRRQRIQSTRCACRPGPHNRALQARPRPGFGSDRARRSPGRSTPCGCARAAGATAGSDRPVHQPTQNGLSTVTRLTGLSPFAVPKPVDNPQAPGANPHRTWSLAKCLLFQQARGSSPVAHPATHMQSIWAHLCPLPSPLCLPVPTCGYGTRLHAV